MYRSTPPVQSLRTLTRCGRVLPASPMPLASASGSMLVRRHRGGPVTTAGSDVGATAAMCSSVLTTALRFFADRPATFAEIAEALKVLDVSINTDEKELKKKYHQLVKKHHPDAGGDEKQMSKISVAYECLTNLSNKDKEQFEVQRRGYSAGSGHSQRGGFQSARSGSGAYRRPYEEAQQYHNTNFYRNQEQARQAQARGGFYNFRNQGPTGPTSGYDPFTQNPFGRTNPFSMNTNFRQFSRMSYQSLFVRGLIVYLLFSLFAASAYRSYRDWANDDGWKMAESLSRHEQLAELHRIRQELKDRMSGMERAREEAYQREGLGTFSGPFRRLSAVNNDAERVKELRALEYAQKRQMDMQMQALEMKGWPKFDPSKGALMKFDNDPIGVVHFEPRVGSQQMSLDGRVISPQPPPPEPIPQGPNNDPDANVRRSATLEKAMREQQRQQAEFIAQQQAAQQQQHRVAGFGSPAAAEEQQQQQQGEGGFSFQQTFVPPHRASTGVRTG